MPSRFMKTSDLAKSIGVHVNTIRLLEEQGFLLDVPRAENGYRQYTAIHLEQARLARLALSWPYIVGEKPMLIELVKSAAVGDLGMGMELAYRYLARVRVERTSAESAVEFLERWASGHLMDRPRQRELIGEAAERLNVTVDMLRNWERSGLIDVPRDPENQYRLYGTTEFGRIRVIRTLVQSGYSLMSILRMLLEFDAGNTRNLRAALDNPRDDEEIQSAADRWLSTLVELEARAQTIIRQIGVMIEMMYPK